MQQNQIVTPPTGFKVDRKEAFIVYVDGHLTCFLDTLEMAQTYIDQLTRDVVAFLSRKPSYRVTRADTPYSVKVYTQTLGQLGGMVDGLINEKHHFEIRSTHRALKQDQ